jgi:hypothetical protein
VGIGAALGDEDLAAFPSHGIDGVLRKPYRMQDLIRTVNEALHPDVRP